MSRMIIGLFSEIAEAGDTVKELTEKGLSSDAISIVANRERCGPALGPVEGLSGGRTIGGTAAVGGAAGLVAGAVALAIPGIGPILAAGPIAAELAAAGVGATAGGFLAGLKQKGVADADAGCFCEAIRRGGILVVVDAPDEKAAEVEEIIGHHRLVDIEDCATEWQKQGWKGFDPEARAGGATLAALPFDPESIRPSVLREKRQRRAVRSYIRIR